MSDHCCCRITGGIHGPECRVQKLARQQFEAGWRAGRAKAAGEAKNATAYHSEREGMKRLSLRERRQHTVRRSEAFDISVAILQLPPPAAQPASEPAEEGKP